MASQEERDNFFSLTLLLFRVGNQRFREYFKTQWPIVYQRVKPGTVPPPWQDTPHDATEMKKIQPSKLKFKFKDEETKFNSGNTNDWDLSLLTSVLKFSSLQFVLPSSPELKGLDDLKTIRNTLIGHATDAAIPNVVFHTAWTNACNALALFNATAADFKSVQDDVKKPLDVLYPMLKQCVKQEKEIQNYVDTIIGKLGQLQQTVEIQHTTLQQTVEKQHETQLEAVGRIERKVDLMLDQGQQGQKRSSTDVQPDESPSSSNTEEPGPSGIDKKKSDERADSSSDDDHPGASESNYHQHPVSHTLRVHFQDNQFMVAVLVLVAGFILYGYIQHGSRALFIDVIGVLLIYLTYWAYRIYYIHTCSQALKTSIKKETESVSKILAHDITSAKTDDIFTNLTVYYTDKKQVKEEQAKGLSRREQLQKYTERTTGFKVKKCEDILIDTRGNHPKILLVTGKPGIGKTMFCEKFIRDWAMDRLFQNESALNIKFAYLLKFRQLSSHGAKLMNLQELLNCSQILVANSVIHDSLFEYLSNNSSEVLILLDGFDEYPNRHREQIASDFEEQCPNDYKTKMPIPALLSKLIKRKLFKNSIVLVSSRPGRAVELGKINFDRHVEISGFSPEQVTEYVDNYFSEPEKQQTKNTVREHIEKNENLVSFCHIPLSCFLLCWCLEWRITQSGTTKSLPAKITDLYDEVVHVAVQKLHAKLKYSKMSGKTMKIAQKTLDKLAELAANLLKQSKYIFEEEDMKELNLTEEEIENLKESGILLCNAGIRTSPFETKKEFSFIHLTFHEYLAASFFVKKKEIPTKKSEKKSHEESHEEWDEEFHEGEASGQTFVFMSGVTAREKDGELMEKLIQQITPRDKYDHVNKLLMLQCLYEYGDDELTKQTINNLYDKYCDSYGSIGFGGVTDVDAKCLSYLLDIIHLLHEQHPLSSSHYTLVIIGSSLTSFGVGVVCDSLVRNSFITELGLPGCSLDDKCVEKITDSLVKTGITNLVLEGNGITDEGAESICRVIIQDDCHVERLYLWVNEKITEECKKRVKQLVQNHKPSVDLDIR